MIGARAARLSRLPDDFGGRSFGFTEGPELTAYRPLVDAIVAAIDSASAGGNQEPEEGAEVIFTAATADTLQLRFIAGDSAKELLADHCTAGQFVGMPTELGL